MLKAKGCGGLDRVSLGNEKEGSAIVIFQASGTDIHVHVHNFFWKYVGTHIDNLLKIMVMKVRKLESLSINICIVIYLDHPYLQSL